jgi:hypothetical protein
MGYEIAAFIAKRGTFEEYKRLSPYITVAQLNQNVDLMLNDWHLDNAISPVHDSETQEFEDMGLTISHIELVKQFSEYTPVAYIKLNFFGGNGYQYGAVWKEGHLVLLPPNNGWVGHIPDENGPVNSALRAIGIEKELSDEFNAVGLRRHRHMEDWFAENTGYEISDYVPDEGWVYRSSPEKQVHSTGEDSL